MNYDFPNKRQYRRTIYRYVDDHCPYPECPNLLPTTRKVPIKPPSERRLLYLESSQCEETKFLVRQRGYHPSQLYPVCDSPAVQAWIVMNAARDGISGLNVANGKVEDLILEYAKKGIFFDSINLDFTGCLSIPICTALAKIGRIIKPYTIVSITILRGREEAGFWDKMFSQGKNACVAVGGDQKRFMESRGCLYGLSDIDPIRIDTLRHSMLEVKEDQIIGGYSFGQPRFGIYKSESGQSMLFLQGVILRHQNVEFIYKHFRKSEAERIMALRSIPIDEHKHIRLYARYAHMKLEFCGALL